MLKNIERTLEKVIFNSRWILAPFYLGLVLGVFLLFIKFAQELWHLATHVVTASEADVSMAITFDPLSAIKIDPPTIRFYSLFALIDSFHLQA